jgi:hypothetical protein
MQLSFQYSRNLREKFDEYHKRNPQVYEAFRKYTLQAIQSGYKHFGAQMIIEHIRWRTAIVKGDHDFKINNDFASFYSRMFILEYPSYSDYFRTRTSVADELLTEKNTK